MKFTISDKNLTPKDNESVNDKKIVRSHTKPNGVNISKADKQHIPVSSEKKKENIPKW